MPSEAYVFPEGRALLWTGVASPITVAYAKGTRAAIQQGWETHESIDGVYAEHQTGQRIDVSISALYSYDATVLRMLGTALHVQLDQASVNGSAGLILYSGHVDSYAHVGDEANPYIYTLNYHAFIYSAYGG